MRVRVTNGRVFDPASGWVDAARDVLIADGRIVADDLPQPGETVYDAAGGVVMAGGIDLHSHIAGGKVNLGRLLMSEDRRAHPEPFGDFCGCGGGRALPTAHATGCLYSQMGYTAVFEPAMLGANARHAHLEMADIPNIDTGGYLVLGNDDAFLQLLAQGEGQDALNDYVAWMIKATQSCAVKLVNPGGISAFKFNGRSLDLDEEGPYYGLTPRRILGALQQAVTELGLPHPIHLHGCNLGVPGNIDTTLATIAAAEGFALHLAHVQFHAYGQEGDRRFSSGAAALAAAVNAHPHVSVDVGQVMFGQTVTASADLMAQYRNHRHASPGKWAGMDIECDAACGVVPFRYRDTSFVHGLQWAIGLELFLLIDDPWRVFLTTDHPNGAPFTTYPHLIRLLMDKPFRDAHLARLGPAVRAHTGLGEIRREYTLEEIAIVTRAAPARALGLADRGHLAPGGVGDLVVYAEDSDREAMFAAPRLVLKNGREVVRDGAIVALQAGSTFAAAPPCDPQMDARMARWFDEAIGLKAKHFRIADHEIRGGRGPIRLECRP
ncbi:formylmethanofuran dehydrogenase subunit A [Aquabacter spiritensis]|uniref:Formylmethanofuran dehydrogenase subunit A n=1 Tax=Aquabacter spiritensis TaxID=933073 RepID=A0A4R3LL86_9HYPH|nr:formylmethanofuran dehydrogenase subunit A [Aquabacter spiritensis]TCT00984.1 formylmethanofuran dehydrogenase subunit A [Aquabacter spiritensis]